MTRDQSRAILAKIYETPHSFTFSASADDIGLAKLTIDCHVLPRQIAEVAEALAVLARIDPPAGVR